MAIEKAERLISLDMLRGLTVAGMFVVNSTARVHKRADAEVFSLLIHSRWDGLTFADLVFPAFLMMVGVSIPLAFRDAEWSRARAAQIASRCMRLLLLGFVLSNIDWFKDFSSGDWRLFGVLQRIGLVYAACALLFLTHGPKFRLALIVAFLVLYWPLTLLPSLDNLPIDLMAPGHNFPASVDRFLIGAGGHLYVDGPAGYDPEGLIGTLPAIAVGLIGVAIGEYLRRKGDASGARTLFVLGACMLIAGLVWSLGFPIIMDIWSSSYVLVTCGITTLTLAALHAWFDRPSRDPVRTGLFVKFSVAFGINAIAAYTLYGFTRDMVWWELLLIPFQMTRGIIGDPLAALLPVLLYTAFLWLCIDYLRRRNWIIRI